MQWINHSLVPIAVPWPFITRINYPERKYTSSSSSPAMWQRRRSRKGQSDFGARNFCSFPKINTRPIHGERSNFHQSRRRRRRSSCPDLQSGSGWQQLFKGASPQLPIHGCIELSTRHPHAAAAAVVGPATVEVVVVKFREPQ